MKKLSCLLLLSSMTFGFAESDLSEVVWVNAHFEVEKCSFGEGGLGVSCDTQNSPEENILIALDNCSVTENSKSCFGGLQSERIRDDVPFYANIWIEKITENGQERYVWTISLGQNLSSRPNQQVRLYPRKGYELSDTVYLEGESFWTKNSYYVPKLVVKPSTLIPEAQ